MISIEISDIRFCRELVTGRHNAVFVLKLCMQFLFKYSGLSLSRSERDPLKHFEVSVLRHIGFAELRKIPNE